MDISELRKQNPWWESASRIGEDPKLREFEQAKVKWMPRLRKYIYLDKDAVYSIRGPRQVGKTTLIKLTIKELLETQNPINIMYFACDLVKDYQALNDLLESYFNWVKTQNKDRIFIFLDEISYVKDWQKSIKFFIDSTGGKNITIILTGSHTLDIKNSTERLPGRVGEKSHVSTNKVLLPMKFAEYVQTRNSALYNQVQEFKLDQADVRAKGFIEILNGKIPESANNLIRILPELDLLLDEYLITGGIMIAVNEYVSNKNIPTQTYEIYIRQLIGDMARINREEKTAKLILASVIKRICTPISFNSIRTENAIPSPPTVEQYVHILNHMFVLNIVYKIDLDKKIRIASDKKMYVLNPFIFHALNGWLLNPAREPYQVSLDYSSNPESKSKLIESVIGDHLNRAAHNLHPMDVFDATDSVFYAKTKKGYEIDYVFRHEDGLYGVDVTYQNELNAEDFRGLIKLNSGCMISKKTFEQKNRICVIPASLFLMYI